MQKDLVRSSLLPASKAILVGLLLAGCASATSPAPITTPSPSRSTAATPPPTTSPTAKSESTETPIAVIDHATGPTDVVLRFDNGRDYGLCELCGGWGEFTPGPEFNLYGDGTVIVRNGAAQPPPAEGPIVRAHPFRIGHLDERQVQLLLRFAIGEGGLETARDRYNTRIDNDETGSAVFTIRAGGLDKSVEIHGNANPFEALRDHLFDIAQRSGIATQVWVPDHYWGLLVEVSSWIGYGLLPNPGDAAIVPWPWPGISPEHFVGPGAPMTGRRVMSPDEAAVLGLSDNGGVVQNIYLREPDGETIYSFSLWPMLPDESG